MKKDLIIYIKSMWWNTILLVAVESTIVICTLNTAVYFNRLPCFSKKRTSEFPSFTKEKWWKHRQPENKVWLTWKFHIHTLIGYNVLTSLFCINAIDELYIGFFLYSMLQCNAAILRNYNYQASCYPINYYPSAGYPPSSWSFLTQ